MIARCLPTDHVLYMVLYGSVDCQCSTNVEYAIGLGMGSSSILMGFAVVKCARSFPFADLSNLDALLMLQIFTMSFPLG